MTRVDSKAYRDGARGRSCSLRIPGVCRNDTETTVFAHLRDSHAGRSIKASDISGCDADFWCHEVMDRRAKMPDGNLISDADWHFYALRGLQETLEARVDLGLLIVKGMK